MSQVARRAKKLTMAAGRDEARTLKKELILEAASKLFFEKSFRGTSMDDICAVRGVTKPFLYHHFSSKDDILLALYEESVEAALNTIRTALVRSDDPLKQLRCFARDYTKLVIREQARVALISREKGLLSREKMRKVDAGKREFLDRLVDILRSGEQRGVFSIADASLAAHAITGAATWVINWYSPRGASSPEDIADHMEQIALQIAGAKSGET